jgi:hypothetical protein
MLGLLCCTVTFVAMSQLRAQARSWQYVTAPDLERIAAEHGDIGCAMQARSRRYDYY